MNSQEAAADFVGDALGKTGLCEANRNLIGALNAAGLNPQVHPLLYHETDPTFHLTPIAHQAKISLLGYNFNQLGELSAQDFRDAMGGQYTIGCWYWELPDLPFTLRREISRVDEIWVASEFVGETLRKYFRGPITVIPNAASSQPAPTLPRSHFNLPEGRFIFFFSFSVISSDARKNPWGLFEAFRRAFAEIPESQRPLLVVKVQQLGRIPLLKEALELKAAAVGARLIGDELTRDEMNALMANIDCYVSLHRSEGYGLGMVEAMLSGKPVIATDYSANRDYLNERNGYPIPYKLIPITAEDHKYEPQFNQTYAPGILWADPDLEAAAKAMREVFENQEAAREKGRIAQQSIQEYCSQKTVGEKAIARLGEIQTLLTNGYRPGTYFDPLSYHSELMQDLSAAFDTNSERWLALYERCAQAFGRIPVISKLLRMLLRVVSIGKFNDYQKELNLLESKSMQSNLEFLTEVHRRMQGDES